MEGGKEGEIWREGRKERYGGRKGRRDMEGEGGRGREGRRDMEGEGDVKGKTGKEIEEREGISAFSSTSPSHSFRMGKGDMEVKIDSGAKEGWVGRRGKEGGG
jgi:hypothetical protein